MYLILDIGGTNMRVGVSKDGKRFDRINKVNVSKVFQEGINVLGEIGISLAKRKKIDAVVCGVAGPLDKGKKMLVNSPYLTDWINRPLKSELERTFKAPVFLENDAALAGLGEAIYGSGKGNRIVAYLTVSTGVGGVRIVNGNIDCNIHGFEPGHQIIDTNGSFIIGEIGSGYLESFISGSSITKRYKNVPEKINDFKVWEECARLLAVGINNVIVHWSPEIVILGGSVALNRVDLKKVKIYLKKMLKIFPEIPSIKKTKLGDEAGLYGGLALINSISDRNYSN